MFIDNTPFDVIIVINDKLYYYNKNVTNKNDSLHQ